MPEEFDLGDFIETLPYEAGPGSYDEYIANALLIKRLTLRNEELRDEMVAEGRRYLPCSSGSHYIGISKRSSFSYSKSIDKLEKEAKALRAKITAEKKLEEATGKAKPGEPSMVLSVRAMTSEVLDRIQRGNDRLEGPDDDDL